MDTHNILTAICTGTDDGYRLRVLEEAGDTVRRVLDLALDWDEFRPASAGHRLIEQGYMIRPDARGPERANGWRAVPGQSQAWSVPVIPMP